LERVWSNYHGMFNAAGINIRTVSKTPDLFSLI